MCSLLHEVSKMLCQVLHIVQTEHIILHPIIVLIRLYVLSWVHQNNNHVFAEIVSDVKVVLLRQTSDVQVVNGA